MDKLKKVLCTGGTGFVAHWLFETKPNDVDLYGLNRGAYQEPWEPGDWDYIIHLAPISPDRVIDYCQHKHIKFLHASSGAVYEGKGKYADDKRAWERRCEASGVDRVVCRLFATSGLPFQKNKALSAFVESAIKGETIKVWGDGSTVRTYLYGFDAATWFWKILLDGMGTYDVGALNPITMFEVATMVSSMTRSKIEFIEHEEMPTPVRYVPEHLQSSWELGCKETVDLRTAIKEMIQNA